MISDGIAKGFVERRREFLWRPEQGLEVVRVPDPDDSETKRSIEEIAPEELDLAIAKLREASGIADGDTLLAQTARTFGFNRTGSAIREQLEGPLGSAWLMPQDVRVNPEEVAVIKRKDASSSKVYSEPSRSCSKDLK